MVIVITGWWPPESTVAQILAERDGVHTRPCHVVVLAPRLEVVEAREAGRLKAGYGVWTVASLYAALEATPRIGLWLDNSDQTPAETADSIMGAI